MIEVAEKQMELINQTFDRLQNASGPQWLKTMRAQAMARFQETGWPGPRSEEYRFTNMKSVSKGSFHAPEPAVAKPSDLSPFTLDGAWRLVFVNGFWDASLSDIENLPEGVIVQSLQEAIETKPDAVKEALENHQVEDTDPFSTLNTALLDQGVFASIGKNVVLEKPIHIIHITRPDGQAVSTTNLVVVEPCAQASVVESFFSLGDGKVWNNVLTQLHIKQNAGVTHYIRNHGNEETLLVAALSALQEADSRLQTHQLLIGGALTRNNVSVKLAGKGADVVVNGLFMGHAAQHQDNHIFIDHAHPHCTSQQFVKGILDGKARGVFSGKVLVRPDAQKTDAKQSNRNLLLSEDARVHTKPQLEIYADDVKCAHGATTGHINEDALFYLQTRGIDPASAMDLLVYAFAHEIIERIPLKAIGQHAESLLFERFSHARMIEE